jgi:hypothetical protein
MERMVYSKRKIKEVRIAQSLQLLGYGLDLRGIVDRFPAEATDLYLL